MRALGIIFVLILLATTPTLAANLSGKVVAVADGNSITIQTTDKKQEKVEESESAEQGDPKAQLQRGLKYYDGIEVKRDYEQAYLWISAAIDTDAARGGLQAEARNDALNKRMELEKILVPDAQKDPLALWRLKTKARQFWRDIEDYKGRKRKELGQQPDGAPTTIANLSPKMDAWDLERQIVSSPHSNQLMKAWKTYQAQDYKAALGLLLELPYKTDKIVQLLMFEAGLNASSSEDHKSAIGFWRPLAERGHDGAQTELGVLYAYGHGNVEQNSKEARKWLQKAGNQGNVKAQATLGSVYEKGLGVPQNYLEAYFWLSLLAKCMPDHPVFQVDAERITAFLKPEQIEIVKKRVKKWKPTSATVKANE